MTKTFTFFNSYFFYRHIPPPLGWYPQRAPPTPRICPTPSPTGAPPLVFPPHLLWSPPCWPGWGPMSITPSTIRVPWRMSGSSGTTWCVPRIPSPVPCLPSSKNSTQVGGSSQQVETNLITLNIQLKYLIACTCWIFGWLIRLIWYSI